MIGTAVFSDDGAYRYELTRVWQPEFGEAGDASLMFVMLNPSTADADTFDPTVRKCFGYAKKWGYSKLLVCNLFALRATRPIHLYGHDDPIGPDNDETLARNASEAGNIVCAWGNHGGYLNRAARVLRILRANSPYLYCLAVTKAGQPGHPLYLRGDLDLIPYGRTP